MSVAECANSVIRAPGHNIRNGQGARFGSYSGFTLIELLVVIAIVAILAAILFPVLGAAKDSGKKARCASQLKQLLAASLAYTDDNNGRYVPAARDIWDSGGGHWRWHGYREDATGKFDPSKGPLWTYLAKSGGIKECPCLVMKPSVQDEDNPDESSEKVEFEAGCGGYGYNAAYVGGTPYKNSWPASTEIASTTGDIASPSRTVMFADAAMVMVDGGGGSYLIEYSFAEPPYLPSPKGKLMTGMSPSIHFRHGGFANVGWCDGHVSAEKMIWSRTNIYGANSGKSDVGWFGLKDNSLFDNM